jgi:hypothetical protein
MNSRLYLHASFLSLSLLIYSGAFADGVVVDRVYDPYVQALEREFEFRAIVQSDDNDTLDGIQLHKLSFGRSWSDRWFTEFYLIGKNTKQDSLSIEAYELETKWQLTEQGEYWADWGLLFEVETNQQSSAWEYGTSLLMSKEWGRWVTTANVGIIYERGDDIANEWDSTLSVQARYRLTRGFEPALEYYGGENTKALGPVFLGDIRTGDRSRLHWEIGVVFGLDDDTPDRTFRGHLEFEF